MEDAREVRVAAGKGIVGNADQGGWRQVTVISRERWEELMREVGVALDPSARRANLLVSGIDLHETREQLLRIGNTRLRVRGETRPCRQMEDAAPGLRDAMQRGFGGGLFAEILTDGSIAIGDDVRWVDDEDDAPCDY